MLLTYWVAVHKYDSHVYSQRAKTKKECLELVEQYEPSYFEPPKKVSVEYRDGFDLMTQCATESSLCWEGPTVEELKAEWDEAQALRRERRNAHGFITKKEEN